jgi:hypothetical protein
MPMTSMPAVTPLALLISVIGFLQIGEIAKQRESDSWD